MTQARTPAAVLLEARRRDSRTKRTKVLAVLDAMIGRGDPVTFAPVAKLAGVSNWLVYAGGVREHIEAARARQSGTARRALQVGMQASPASLKTDLHLARAEAGVLRSERDQLRAALQRHLGHQLDQISANTLIERANELTQANLTLLEENAHLKATHQLLEDRLAESEDDLSAARASLRRMIRDNSQ